MIEKTWKAIIADGRGESTDITREQVECYLEEVRAAVKSRRYRLDRNSKRIDNNALFDNFVISESDVEKIICSLTSDDFSDILPNEHPVFEYERLYVFGKRVKLLERFGSGEEVVDLYIKFNKLENQFLIVISFHKQKYPLEYYFL